MPVICYWWALTYSVLRPRATLDRRSMTLHVYEMIFCWSNHWINEIKWWNALNIRFRVWKFWVQFFSHFWEKLCHQNLAKTLLKFQFWNFLLYIHEKLVILSIQWHIASQKIPNLTIVKLRLKSAKNYTVSELEVTNYKRLEMIENQNDFWISCMYLQVY